MKRLQTSHGGRSAHLRTSLLVGLCAPAYIAGAQVTPGGAGSPGGTAGAGFTPNDGSPQSGVAVLRLNEVSVYRRDAMNMILHDREFVELIGTPGQLLGNVVILVIEGEGADAGVLERAWRIPAGRTMPADGFFVIGDSTVTERDIGFPGNPFIEEGTETFFVIRANDPAAVVAMIGTDLDTNNDGMLDTPISSLGVVADGVAVQSTNLSTRTYATPVVARGISPFTPGFFRLCHADSPATIGPWSVGAYLNADQSLTTGNPPTPGAPNQFGQATLFGLPHTALGQARLCLDGADGVEVSNVGASGQDGVRIDLGTAQGWTGAFAPPTECPIGSGVNWTLRGVVNAVPDQTAITGRIECTASGEYGIFGDASMLGASGALVEIIDDGDVVGSWEATASSEPLFRLIGPGTLPWMLNIRWLYLEGSARSEASCEFWVSTGGQAESVFDYEGPNSEREEASASIRIRVTPMQSTADLAAFNSFDLTIVGNPGSVLTVGSQNLIQSEHAQRGLGFATLAGQADGSTMVSYAGIPGQPPLSGEEYGASADFSPSGAVGAIVIEPVGTEDGDERVRTIVRAADGSVAAETGIMFNDGLFTIYGNYSALAPTGGLLIRGLLDGVVVDSTTRPGPILDPGDITFPRRGCIWRPCQVVGPDHVASLAFDPDTTVQFGQNQPVLVDEIQLVALGSDVSIMIGVIPKPEFLVTGYQAMNVLDIFDFLFTFGGLNTRALGSAHLSVVDDGAVLLAGADSPDDGMAIDVGGAGSGRWTILMPSPDLVDPGTRVQFRSYDQLSAPSSNYSIALSMTSDGSTFELGADLSNIVGGPVTLRLYDDDDEVLAQTVNPADFPPVDIDPWLEFCPIVVDDCFTGAGGTVHLSMLEFASDVIVHVPGHQPLSIDTIVIQVANFTPPSSGVARKELSIDNGLSPVDPLLVFKPEIGKFGNYHRSLGDADITAIDEGLFISSIGPSGLDGVRINTDSSALNIGATSINNGVIPAGSSLAVSARAVLDGGQTGEEFMGSMTTTMQPDNSAIISADFSTRGSTTSTIAIFNDGVELISVSGQSGDLLRMTGVVAGSPTTAGVGPDEIYCQWEIPPCLVVVSTGQMFFADEFRIRPDTPQRTAVSIDSMSLRYRAGTNGDHPDVRLLSETVVPVPPPPPVCPCDFNMDAALNSQDFFEFLACFFSPGNPLCDFDRSGAVDSADFFAFLTCFFDPAAGCN